MYIFLEDTVSDRSLRLEDQVQILFQVKSDLT